MSQTLVIPSEAKCSRCGIYAKNQESVWEIFSVRIIDGQMKAQSQCKKCKSLKLTKELKEKLNNYKEALKKEEETIVGRLKESHDERYNSVRDSMKEQLQKINDDFKHEKQKISDQIKDKIEAKRQELYKQIKN